ncbi:MAG TPA: helix-turn-helix domain-containing protein [Verrucomicrobiae bacterium]
MSQLYRHKQITTGEHLTIRQFAERFQVHPQSVWRWLKKGKLKGVRVGARWRISAQEFGRVEQEGTAL